MSLLGANDQNPAHPNFEPDPTDLLADWKAKTDAATEGPWVFSFAGHDDYEPGLYPQVLKMDNGDTIIELDAGSREVNEASGRFRYDADFIAVSRTAMPLLLAAVESVLGLHTPVYPYPGPDVACFHCAAPEPTPDDGTWVPYPCATVRAIESALGGGD